MVNDYKDKMGIVDYEDEVSAATALVRADNMLIKSKYIKVALSNPPKRKNEPETPSSSEIKSLGGTGSKDFGPRGKGVHLLQGDQKSARE